MDFKFLKIVCFVSFIVTINADPNFVDSLENVARTAFKKHYPTFTFEKLLSTNIEIEEFFINFVISSRADSLHSGSNASFLCSLKVKVDSFDTPASDPQVKGGTCKKEVSSHATARQSGAVRDINLIHNVTQEEMGLVNELADFAAKKLDEIDADNRRNVVEEVLNPTKQFAGGILYAFKLRLMESNCAEDYEDNNDCTESSGNRVKLCDVKVLRTWALKNSPHATLVESHCEAEYETWRKPKKFDVSTFEEESSSSQHSKKKLLGGPREIDVNDEKVMKYAKESLEVLDDLNVSKYKLGLIRVVSAKIQADAELSYFLTLEVGHSKCPKTDSKGVEYCKEFFQPQICNVQVCVRESTDSVGICHVSCENKLSAETRIKRSPMMSGGLWPQSVNDTDIQKYAILSLSTLEGLPGSEGKLKLVEVMEAHSQVVSGVMYHLKLKVANSKSDSKICHAKVWVHSWISPEPEVTDASCEDTPSSRKKRSGIGALGDLQPINVNDEQVQRNAKFALSSLASQFGSGNELKLVEVVEAHEQVVAGTLYHLKLKVADSKANSKICNVKVVEQPWISKEPKVTDASCDAAPSSRKKRTMPGGLEPISKDDKDVKKYAQLSVSSLESLPGWGGELKFVEVVEAHSQVVSGILYHLKLRVGTSKEDSKICNTKIWVQPWLNLEKVTAATCEDKPSSRRKRALFGGLKPISKDDSEVKKYAQLSVSSLESLPGWGGKLKFVEVVDAQSQVVSGTLYHLKLRVGTSKEDSKICNTDVWVQPWLNSEKVTEATCEDKPSSRQKRALVGGLEAISKDSQEVKKYAQLSVSSLESLPGWGGELKFVEVVEAHSQVVSGTLYHLKLRVGTSKEDSKICNTKVWVQPWLRSEKVTAATCEDKPSSRKKRTMPGGLEPISKDDKDVKKYAQLSVSSLETLPGWGGKLMFVEVVEAHSQVVSGTLYHLKLRVGTSKEDSKICNTKVWVQPWLQSEKVTEATCEDKPSSRRKRALTSGLNFGEFQKLNTDDESLQEYAKVAVATIEDAIESDYKLELIRVVDASVRMVSGRMYSLKLEVGHPNCTKFSDESECSEELFDPKICNVKVWVQDWLNSVKVTDVMCDGISLERKKRTENMLLGGIEPFSVDDENVLKYANASLAKLDGLGTSEYKLGLKRVVNATVQVVAGISYSLKLEVGLSKCPKSDPNPKLDCSENLTDTKMCHVKVWVRDWLNSTEITAASCEDKPTSATRRKRSNIDYEEESHLEASDETKAKYSDFLQTSLEHDHFPEQESKSAHRLVQINLFSTETPSLSYENEENLEYLNVTMKSLDELTPSTFKLGLIKLIDLRKQIGPKNISLHLKLQVGYTKCPKSEDDSVEPVACAKDLYEPRKCQVKLTITSEPRKIDIESAVCDGIPDKISNRRKRLSISGRQSLNVESEDIQRKSKELLSALSHNFKNGTVLSLNRTVEARVQVVNGALFTYILEVLADEPCGFDGVALFCNDKKDSTHRQVRKYCSVKVLEKEWLKFSEVLFTKCASNLSKLQKV